MRKILKLVVLSTTFAVFAMGAIAQEQAGEVHKFSLKEAIEYAKQHNQSIMNANLDIRIAKQKIWETTSIGLPQVNGEVNYNNMIDIPTSLLPAEMFGGAPGTKIPVSFGTKNNLDWGVTASQIVFSGEYIVGLQASKIYLDLSKRSYDKTLRDTEASIKQAYYLNLVAKASLFTLDSTYQNLNKVAQEMKIMQEQGFLEITDVQQMELNALNVKNTLIAIKNQAAVADRLFKFMIGMPFEEQIELTEDLETLIISANLSGGESQNFDINGNSDFKLLQTQEALSLLSLRREKTTLLPSLGAFWSYQKKAQRDEFDFFDDHGDEDVWFPTNIVGLQIKIPLFGSGMKVSKITQAKMEYNKMQNTKAMMQQSLNQQFVSAKADFENGMASYRTNQQSKALSVSIYRRSVEKYKQGLISASDLTQIQNQYLQAETNYLQSVVTLLTAKADLDKMNK